MNTKILGWNNFFEAAFRAHAQEHHQVGRVSAEHKNLYELYTPSGVLSAVVSGRFQHRAQAASDFPAVGDWVLITENKEECKAVIHAVLPRKSRFSRNAAGGKPNEQIVAANIDIVFIASSVNKDFNLRRIERYLAMAWEGETMPVVILTKSDLCNTVEEHIQAVQNIARDVPIHAVSALHNRGLDELSPYIGEGVTIAVLGSSGVGKSTLVNAMVGENILEVSSIGHYKDKGQHTTTHRQMVLLPSGGVFIDTPGMRELQLWHGEQGLQQAFSTIEELLDKLQQQCRFPNCSHTMESGCAIQKALDDGLLDEQRYASYQKLQKEVFWQQRKKKNEEKVAMRKHSKKPYNRKMEKSWNRSNE